MATNPEITGELRMTMAGVINTLLLKREDYGTQNIAATGRYGLSVRLQDKVSRLLNMTSGGEPNFESLEDTYKDIIGYALIGLHGEHWGLEALPHD